MEHSCENKVIINNMIIQVDKLEDKFSKLEGEVVELGKDSVKYDTLMKQLLDDKKEQSIIIKELSNTIKESSTTMIDVKYTMKQIQTSLQENKTEIDTLNSSFESFKSKFNDSENKNKIDLRDIQKEAHTSWLKKNWSKLLGFGGFATVVGLLIKLLDILSKTIK